MNSSSYKKCVNKYNQEISHLWKLEFDNAIKSTENTSVKFKQFCFHVKQDESPIWFFGMNPSLLDSTNEYISRTTPPDKHLFEKLEEEQKYMHTEIQYFQRATDFFEEEVKIPEVVLEAVQNNGNALRLASNELHNAPELKKYCSNITIDSKKFREDSSTKDYYKSKLDLNRYDSAAAHLIEWFIDNLGDGLQWQDMEKGESKKFGNGTVLCVDRNLKADTSGEEVEGDILIMLTNDECLDDTIKIRFKIEAIIYENSLEIQDQSTYYLDSEGQENPLNYSNFLELYQIIDDLA